MGSILVTGCAGFIGSHLVQRLLAAGESVVGVDCFIDTYDPAAKRRNLAGAADGASGGSGGFALVEADIRDAAAMDAAIGDHGVDRIVHLAALAGVRPSIERPALYADINLTGTVRLLDAAVKHKVAAFVFGSSSSVYGNNAKVPFAESDPVDRPISPYAATKRSGELLAHAYHHVHGLSVSCLRFFTVYGPRQRPDLAIMKFMRLIRDGRAIPVFGDGSTSRDYTYVSDIVDGVTAAIGHTARGGVYDLFNLGSHRPISLSELIAAIERATGKRATIDRRPMQPGDVERTYADVSHSKRVLGYEPKTPLEQGLAEQWAWVERHG